MAPICGDFLNSRFFKFIVGPNKKEFIVHADVFANLSKPLNVLINGPFTEAKDGYTIWDEVTEETFNRLRQFAYCGDYDCVEPKFLFRHTDMEKRGKHGKESLVDPNMEQDLVPVSRPLRNNGYRWTLPYSIQSMYHDKRSRESISIIRNRPRDKFTEVRNYDGRVATINALVDWYYDIGLANTENRRLKLDTASIQSCENLREIFFYHADLHILAEKYCITDLIHTTTTKLGKLLHTHTWTSQSIQHFADLIPYIFGRTTHGSPMRETLV